MPYPDDPYAIPPPATPAQDAPWLPDWWNYAGPSEQAQPAELQPGMGIPAPMVDQAAPDAIEMPVDYVGTPTIGQPQVPIEAEPMFPGGPPPAGEPIPYPEPVDAISGNVPAIPSYVEPSAVELRSERLTNPQDVPEETIPYGVQLTPGQRAEQFAAMPEEDRLRSQMEWIRQRDAAEAARRSKMDLDDRQRQVENQAIIDRARAEARARAIDLDDRTRKLAEENVDPERWWSSRDTGQKIAGFMAAILGGLVQGRRGGPNSGIEMMDRAIEQDIDAQKANMAHRRAMLQQQGASNEMLAQMAEQDNRIADEKRIANYHYLEKQLATDMAQWDPAGRNAIETGAMIRATRDKRAAAIAAMEDQNFKQMVDAQKAEADIRKANADAAKSEAEAAKLRGAGMGGGGVAVTKFDEIARTPKEWEKFGVPGVKGDQPLTLKQIRQLQPAVQAGMEIAGEERGTTILGPATAVLDEVGNPIVGPDGMPVIDRSGKLRNQDGTDWLAPSKTLRDKLAAQKSAATQITTMIDDVIELREQARLWSPSQFDGAQQKLKVLEKRLSNVAKAGTQGMSSDQDMANLAGSLGAKDLTSFLDQSAGLEEGRQRTVDAFNTSMRDEGSYTGNPIVFPTSRGRKPITTPKEKEFEDALVDTSRDAREAIVLRRRSAVQSGQYGPKEEEEFNKAMMDASINPTARKIIGDATTILTNQKSSQDSKTEALKTLAGLAERAQNEATRLAAHEAIGKYHAAAYGIPEIR